MQEHIRLKDLRLKGYEFEAASSSCPKCGRKPMQVRYAKKGNHFLGCRDFPGCRGTRSLKDGGEAPTRHGIASPDVQAEIDAMVNQIKKQIAEEWGEEAITWELEDV